MNNFNPSTFYISIIDLFAILLPGSLASLMIHNFYQNPIDEFLDIGAVHTGFYSAFALLFAAYLFGHIISQVSAYLDEWVYDPLKRKVYKDHKRVERVMDIREHKFGNAMKPVYVNTYKWSVFKLQKDYPEASAEIERYMADSKFFRSLFVILLVLGIIFILPSNSETNIAVSCFALAAFSMIRYFKKRRKSTEMAYRYIIFLEDLNTRIESTYTDQRQNIKT